MKNVMLVTIVLALLTVAFVPFSVVLTRDVSMLDISTGERVTVPAGTTCKITAMKYAMYQDWYKMTCWYIVYGDITRKVVGWIPARLIQDQFNGPSKLRR